MDSRLTDIRFFLAAAALSAMRRLRRGAVGLTVTGAALVLTACGGGGDGDGDSVDLGLNVIVAGQPVPGVFVPGFVGTVNVLAGQSIELAANEPVDWAFSIGASPLFDDRTTVFHNGLAITQTAVGPSRVVLDTVIVGPFLSPVVITFTAISTFDAAEVATVNVVVQ